MARQIEYLVELQLVIQRKYQCGATHRETVFVQEKMEKDEIVWGGYVEIFDLVGHDEARICYAWQDIRSDGIRTFTILENKLIDSPHRAVQAAVFVDAQPLTEKTMSADIDLLKKRIEAGKKALYESEIKSEDLEATIQAVIRTQEEIKQKQKPSH